VAPAALPPAPIGSSNAPVPTVSWGAAPSADTTAAAAPEKKFNRFTFTRFTWGNSVSLQSVGLGESFQSPAPSYTQSFSLNLRYYYLALPRDKAYVNVSGEVDVELTDSPNTSTTYVRQPLLNDILIGTSYGHTVYESANKETKITPGVGLSFALPTSLASQSTGKYLTLGVTANLVGSIGLAGSKSDWFPDGLAFVSAGYSHLFSRCYLSCNGGAPAQFPRQLAGNTAGDVASVQSFSDQLSAASLAIDKVTFNFTYYLSLYKDLTFGNTWAIQAPFKHAFSSTTVGTLTGAAPIAASYPGEINPVTTFDVSFSYVLFNTARIDLGYQNITPELLDNNGQRNNVFYSIGGSAFYGNASLYIDNLIDKAMNPPDKKTALSLGRFHPIQH
jgi:hypothetical protein